MRGNRERKLELIRLSWIIYTGTTLVLIVIAILLSWSVLTILWMLSSAVLASIILNFLYRTEMDRQAEHIKAERLENSKSDYLANMSHEIRTPMNAIVGMCELTLREKDISETVIENCKNIQSSGRSLLSIINDILDFSKIESGKMEIIEEEFNIKETINDVINMAITRKGDKPIEVLVKVAPDIPRGLFGDELRIRQIIINIITNAVKYTKRGAAILSISCTQQNYGVNLNVRVKDTGIGISEENMEKLFVSFQQVDTKKNRSVEGTGLGLAISKRLITRMGGFINVRSKEGYGSEFRVTIPLRVTNATPLLKVKNANEIHALSYINFTRFKDRTTRLFYREMASSIARSLNVDYHNFTDFDSFINTLDIFSDRITHCFTGKVEYIENKEFFDKLSTFINVILIQDKSHAITPGGNIRNLFKPLYAVNIVALLNNETIGNVNEHAFTGTRFIAPKAHVLIVDDNELNREVAVGLMKPYRMNMYTAKSAKEAFDILKDKKIHLVFMDHMMPEIDGVEATQIIRANQEDYYQKLPIVALTANAINGVKEMFIDAGFNDFMPKPIEIPTLDRMLKHWLPDKFLEKPGEEDEAIYVKSQEHVYDKNYEISIEKGLYYTGGDVDAFKRVVAIYIKNGEEKIELIQQYFDKENWNDYRIEVHALKSSSLTIGAEMLSDRAKTIEEACKDDNITYVKDNNSELLEMYRKVVKSCQDYLSENPIEKKEIQSEASRIVSAYEPEYAFIIDYLKLIIKAADDFDNEEIIKLCSGASASAGTDKIITDKLNAIRECGEDFEYDEAKKLSEELIAEIESREA